MSWASCRAPASTASITRSAASISPRAHCRSENCRWTQWRVGGAWPAVRTAPPPLAQARLLSSKTAQEHRAWTLRRALFQNRDARHAPPEARGQNGNFDRIHRPFAGLELPASSPIAALAPHSHRRRRGQPPPWCGPLPGNSPTATLKSSPATPWAGPCKRSRRPPLRYWRICARPAGPATCRARPARAGAHYWERRAVIE